MAATEELPTNYVKLAKAQLRKDPTNVSAHVEVLRRWLASTPHLTGPDDEEFLVMFLLQNKYLHAEAQARLNNFCTLSTKKFINDVIWGTPLDLNSNALDSYLNAGVHLPLGYHRNGRMGVWIRPGAWNPDVLSLAQMIYYAHKVIYVVALDPRTIIGETVVLVDFTGSISGQIVKDPNKMKSWSRFLQ
ncbi:alpha tocopherol transfer protein [Echinococcus multilocularis]|uniref:Alpha tocopherol transfer protein n=1 Tax=Echinococcus multilocularis TaxID=6211 RepID=A0A0S4MJW1_ECHMU|nr:alpha tocopherol transfer protein [Echinococcus multilocularis]